MPSLHPSRTVTQALLLATLLLVCPPLPGAQSPRPSTAEASARASFQNGLRLQHAGQLAEAQRAFARAHTLAPQDPAIATALGKLDAMLGRAPEAVQLFRAIVAGDPRSSDNQANLAIALATAGSLEEALTAATRAVALDPRSAGNHHLRGKILAARNQPSAAAADFDQALAIEPSNTLTLYDYALLAESTGQLSRQVSLLERLNHAAPGKADNHLLLARALVRTGNLPAAQAEFREAIRLDPDNRGALYGLSRLLKSDHPEEAAQLADRFRALRLSEEELNGIRTQGNAGVAAMDHGDWPTAIAAFQAALTACAGCTLEATLEKDLGLAQCRSGDTVAGAASLRRSLALNPRDLDALQALEIATKGAPSAP